jgi:DNA-directed RNA polymerase specialized sigma24 family protein
LIFEELSELIKEACICEEKDISIIDLLRKLPPQSAVPLMMSICLDMSIRDIAKYHDCSKTKMDTIIKKSIVMLRACIYIN